MHACKYTNDTLWHYCFAADYRSSIRTSKTTVGIRYRGQYWVYVTPLCFYGYQCGQCRANPAAWNPLPKISVIEPTYCQPIQLFRKAIVDNISTNPPSICLKLPDPNNARYTVVSSDADANKSCPSDMVAGTITLDDLAAKYGSPPDVLKIDVEGFEVKTLAGFSKTLSKSPPIFIVLEYTNPIFQTMADALAALFAGPLSDYTMFDIAQGVEYTNSNIPAMVEYLSTSKSDWNTDLLIFRNDVGNLTKPLSQAGLGDDCAFSFPCDVGKSCCVASLSCHGYEPGRKWGKCIA